MSANIHPATPQKSNFLGKKSEEAMYHFKEAKPLRARSNGARNTSWNEFAKWYDRTLDDQDSYQKKVILPALQEMVHISGNEKILDIGCGTGFFTSYLGQRAKFALGIDSAQNLLQIARKKFGKTNIKFEKNDASQSSQVISQYGKFDVATCIMAIENMANASKVLKEASKTLNANGRLLLIMNHPAFRIPKKSSWGWDEKQKTQYRRIDSYFSELRIPIQMHPGDAPSEITWTFHRPLQTYFQYLKENRFVITDLRELFSHKKSKPGSRAKAENRIRNEIPMFLAILARKG